MKRIEGRIALVTGGGSGIGRATCLRLAEDGAHVIVTDLNEEGGRDTVDAIEARGSRAAYFHHDVTSEREWEALMEVIETDHGRLDVLVNNAGLFQKAYLDDIPFEDFRRIFAVNVDGVFLGLKHGARLMRKDGGGSIINLSSSAGIVGSAGAIPYCGTKGAVRLMTKAAGVELARFGIRVNSVHPGFVSTPMGDQVVRAASGDFDERKEMLARAVPAKSWADPEDIANGIAFLASDVSRYMTGSELVIDGGATAQ